MGRMITKENKDKAIAKVARNKADVGSPEVQVSILTEFDEIAMQFRDYDEDETED